MATIIANPPMAKRAFLMLPLVVNNFANPKTNEVITAIANRMYMMMNIKFIAPLLIAFGSSADGMIAAFQKIAAVGNLSASLIAGDIQVALLTTVFGLNDSR